MTSVKHRMETAKHRIRPGAFGLLWLVAACSATELQRGNRYFRAGDYDRAASTYRQAIEGGDRSPALLYNYGTTLLHLERYDEARPILELSYRAAAGDLSQRAYYNAGNADLMPVFLDRSTEGRVEQLERAIEAYKRALLLWPPDMDAKWNLELAQRLLEQEPRSGGGGGGNTPQSGGGGGGESRSPSRPNPGTSGPDGTAPPAPMTRAEADRIFAQIQQAERAVQREVLRRAQNPPQNVRDW